MLYQNDDFGKDYLKGLKDGLGAKASMIIAEESYETTEPTIDTHIVKLKATGADVFINITTPKFAAQAIKKIAEIDWKPLHIVTNVSASVGSVMQAGGLRECARHALGGLRQGRRRSAVEQRSRHEEVARLPRQVHARTPTGSTARRLRLRRGADPGEGAARCAATI